MVIIPCNDSSPIVEAWCDRWSRRGSFCWIVNHRYCVIEVDVIQTVSTITRWHTAGNSLTTMGLQIMAASSGMRIEHVSSSIAIYVSTLLCCIYTALHCFVINYIVLHCIVFHCNALKHITMQFTDCVTFNWAFHCNALNCTACAFTTYYSALNCITLNNIAQSSIVHALMALHNHQLYCTLLHYYITLSLCMAH